MTLPCLYWPRCQFGNKCRFDHPRIACKFQPCLSSSCPYDHNQPPPYFLTLEKVNAMHKCLQERGPVKFAALLYYLRQREPSLTKKSLLDILGDSYETKEYVTPVISTETHVRLPEPQVWKEGVRFVSASCSSHVGGPKPKPNFHAPISEGIGFRLLQKMGWNPGEGLGIQSQGIKDPIMIKPCFYLT